jgi:hypothetical protein
MEKPTETLEDGALEEEPPLSRSLPLRRSIWSATRALGHEMGRDTWNALRLIVVLLVLCGVVFPLIVFVIGQVAFPDQANGSLVRNQQGQVIGSKLLGQQFTRPEYFHGRPSVTGYDASNSSGSNLGPTNPQLIEGNGSEVTVAAGHSRSDEWNPGSWEEEHLLRAGELRRSEVVC